MTFLLFRYKMRADKNQFKVKRFIMLMKIMDSNINISSNYLQPISWEM